MSLFVATVALALTGLSALPVRAQPDWTQSGPVKARLVRFGHQAVFLIQLEPGWTIFWRHPGGPGYPPKALALLGASDNLRSQPLDLRWPAPHRWRDHGDNIVGYRDRAVLFVKRVPPDLQSARLRLGVCLDVCMPVDMRLPPDDGGMAPDWQALVRQQSERVPQANGTDGITILPPQITRAATGVMIDVSARVGTSLVGSQFRHHDFDLFIAGTHVPPHRPPVRQMRADHPVVRFRFHLSALPAKGGPLRLVLRWQNRSVVRIFRGDRK